MLPNISLYFWLHGWLIYSYGMLDSVLFSLLLLDPIIVTIGPIVITVDGRKNTTCIHLIY